MDLLELKQKVQAFLSPKDFHTRLIKRIKKDLLGSFYIDPSVSLDNSIILVGSMRSGTTWLAELLSNYYQYRFISEPFHSNLPIGEMTKRLYIPPDSKNKYYFQVAEKVFSGQIRTKKLDNSNFILLPKGKVIKTVQALLMLPWIQANFKLPIVYIIRHPCAQALSMRDTFPKSKNINRLTHIYSQKNFVDSFLTSQGIQCELPENEMEIFAYIWSIENSYALRNLDKNNCIIIFYEDLVKNFSYEMKKITNYINPDEKFNVKKLVSTSSSSSSILISKMSADQKLSKWRKRLTSEEISKILAIVEKFSLKDLYGADIYPNHQFLENF